MPATSYELRFLHMDGRTLRFPISAKDLVKKELEYNELYAEKLFTWLRESDKMYGLTDYLSYDEGTQEWFWAWLARLSLLAMDKPSFKCRERRISKKLKNAVEDSIFTPAPMSKELRAIFWGLLKKKNDGPIPRRV